MNHRFVLAGIVILLAATTAAVVAGTQGRSGSSAKAKEATMKQTAKDAKDANAVERLELSEAEWQERLTPEQFHVLREEGTERAFTGKYWDNEESGVYVCAGCGLPLFSSETKYKSGTGWPSFWQPVDPSHVRIVKDATLGMVREEIECARCGGHQGHVFDDGPKPTGLRYCINSASLAFEPAGEEGKSAKK